MVSDGEVTSDVRDGAPEGGQQVDGVQERFQLEASLSVLVFLTFLSFWATVYHDVFWVLHIAFKVGALSYFIFWVGTQTTANHDEDANTEKNLSQECPSHVTTATTTSTQDGTQPGDGLIFLKRDKSRRGTFKFSRRGSAQLLNGIDPDQGTMSRSGRGASFRLIKEGDGWGRKRDQGSFRIVQKKNGQAELVREDSDFGQSRRKRTIRYADEVVNDVIKEEDESEAGKDMVDGPQTKSKGSFRFNRGKVGPSILRTSKKFNEDKKDVSETSSLLPEADANESMATNASTRRKQFKSNGSIQGVASDGRSMMRKGQGSGSFMLVPVTPGSTPPKQAPGSFVLRPDGGAPDGQNLVAPPQTGDMVDGRFRSRSDSTVSNRGLSLNLKSRRPSNHELNRRHSIGIQTLEQDRKQSVHQHVHYQVYQYYGKLVNISGEGPVIMGDGNQLNLGAPSGDEAGDNDSTTSSSSFTSPESSEEDAGSADEDISFDFEYSDEENLECDSIDGDFIGSNEEQMTAQHEQNLSEAHQPVKETNLDEDSNGEDKLFLPLPRRSHSERTAATSRRPLIRKSNSAASDFADVASPFRNREKKKRTVQQILAGIFSPKKKK